MFSKSRRSKLKFHKYKKVNMVMHIFIPFAGKPSLKKITVFLSTNYFRQNFVCQA